MLGSFFGGRAPRGRPDFAAWDLAAPTLVVDGTGPGLAPFDALPSARRLVHGTSGGPGLPYAETDRRRLDERDASAASVVLADVLDALLDAAPGLAEARRVLRPGGTLLVVQCVAPEDFDGRAAWNAVARLRDPRRTWTLSPRQLAALVASLGMTVEREEAWEETADPAATLRPELARQLTLLLDAVAARGGAGFLRDDGALVVSRRAALLRRGG